MRNSKFVLQSLICCLLFIGWQQKVAAQTDQQLTDQAANLGVHTTPELTELARSFGADPMAAFNWVRSNIQTQYYYTCRKGAHATLIEGAGGVLDKSLLLFSVLKQMTTGATLDPKFQYVTSVLPADFYPPLPPFWDFRSPSWPEEPLVSVADMPSSVTSQPFAVQNLYAWQTTWAHLIGFPVAHSIGGPNECFVTRLVVTCSIDGQRKMLDPFTVPFPQTSASPVESLFTGVTGLSAINLKASLGALAVPPNSDPSYSDYCLRTSANTNTDVQIGTQLSGATSAVLTQVLQAGVPPVEEYLPEIWPVRPPFTSIGFTSSGITISQSETTAIPSAGTFMPRIEIAVPGTSHAISLHAMALRGRRLAIVAALETASTVKVRVLLEETDQTWTSGAASVTVPSTSRILVSMSDGSVNPRFYPLSVGTVLGARYLWVLQCSGAFHPNEKTLAARVARLHSLRSVLADPTAAITMPLMGTAPEQDKQEKVILETLNIQSQQYGIQCRLAASMIGKMGGCLHLYRNVNGRVFQGPQGNTIDMFNSVINFPLDGSTVCSRRTLQVTTIVESALEHAVIEQSGGFARTGQKNVFGVSTARVIQQAFNQRSAVRIARGAGNPTGNLPYASSWSTPAGSNAGYGNPDVKGTYSESMGSHLQFKSWISSVSRSANVVTLTCEKDHDLAKGNRITVSGVLPGSFNGTFIVSDVLSGSTLQFAQTGPDDPGLLVALVSMTRSSNTVTFQTSAAHGLAVGNTVTVSGAVNSTFDGEFEVLTVPSATSFTVAQTGANGTSTGGTFIGSVKLDPLSTVLTSMTRASNTVTFQTSAAHSLAPGHTVQVSGAGDSSFNGAFEVATVPSANSFTAAQTGVNATSTGGSVIRANDRVAIWPQELNYAVTLPGGTANTGAAFAVTGYGFSGQMLGGIGGGRSFSSLVNTSTPVVNSPSIFSRVTQTVSMFARQVGQLGERVGNAVGSFGARTYGADPVNVASGAFELVVPDVEVGTGSAPRGLSLMRSYNSLSRSANSAGLGRGWDHSWNLDASIRSDYNAAFGREDLRQAIPMLVMCKAMLNVHTGKALEMKASDYTMLYLIACWGMEQITGNAVSFRLGSESVDFVKIPNGGWLSAGNPTMTLEAGTGTWIVRARNGNSYTFWRNDATPNSVHKVEIRDPDTALLTANFHDTGRVKNVTDAAGRALVFVYADNVTGKGALVEVKARQSLGSATDERRVHYGYSNTSTQADLLTARDESLLGLAGSPAWTYEYAASDGLLTRQLNPEGQVIVRNIYDPIGRVREQFSMGLDQPNDARRWGFLYQGTTSVEIDPFDKKITHFYDQRGREHALEVFPASNTAQKQISRRAFDAKGNMVASATYPDLTTAMLDAGGNRLVDAQFTSVQMERLPTVGALTWSESVFNNHSTLEVERLYLNGTLQSVVEHDYEFFTPSSTPAHATRNIVRLVQTRSSKDNPAVLSKVMTIVYNGTTTNPTVQVKEILDGPAGSTTKTAFTYYPSSGSPVSRRGLPETITDRVSRVTKFQYDSYGTPDWVTGTGGFADYDYVWNGDILRTVTGHGDNQVTVNTVHDKARRVTHTVTVTGAQQTTARTVYDKAGRPVESWHVNHTGTTDLNTAKAQSDTLPKLVYSRTAYNALDEPTETVAGYLDDLPPAGSAGTFPRTQTAYDLKDRPKVITDVLGLSATVNYLVDGSLSSIEESYLPGANRTSSVLSYDAFGAPLEERDVRNRPSINVFQRNVPLYAGGPVGNITTTTFGGVSTSVGTDFAGRLRTITNGKNAVSRIEYNDNDLPITVQTPRAYRSRRVYDAEGRIKEIHEQGPNRSESQTANYTFHPPVAQYESAGLVPTAAQLQSGRVKDITLSLPATANQAPATVHYSDYTVDGRPGRVGEDIDDARRDIVRQFKGNKVSNYIGQPVPADTLQPAGYAVGYDYYPDGSLKAIYYPDMNNPGDVNRVASRSVTYTYFRDGKLKTVTDNFLAPAAVTSFTWNKDGSLNTITRPNGTVRSHRYDGGGRLFAVDERLAGGGALISTSRAGLGIDDRIDSQLKFPVLPTNKSLVSFTGALYDDDNRIENLAGVGFNYHEDGNFGGNLAEGFGVKPSEKFDFVFDTRSRLVAMNPDGTDPDGTDPARNTFAYTYDSEGVRNSRTDYGPKTPTGSRPVVSFTRYIYEASSDDAPRLLVRRIGTQWVRYVYGIGVLYQVSGTGSSVTERRYYHCDDAANVIAITDHPATGLPRITDRFDYTPYGQLRHHSNPTAGVAGTDTPFRFAGMTGVVSDPDGIIYMNARYYSPALGRFINGDPAGFDGGMNWHAYASGNPLSYVDPSGYGPSATRVLLQTGISAVGMIFGPVGVTLASGINAFISAAAGDHVGAYMHLAGAALGAGGAIASYARPAGSLIPTITNTGRTYSPFTPRALPPPSPPRVQPNISNPTGTGCFAAGTPVATPKGPTAIETLKVGDRVTTPDSESGNSKTSIDPATWSLVSLTMQSPDGSGVLTIQSLVSPEWMAANDCRAGAQAWMHFDELGIQGECDVQSIAPCPPLASGAGQMVLTTATHRSTFLREIRFEGVDPPLLTTAPHRFYSASRQEWVAANDLQPGDTLKTAGATVTVASVNEIHGTHQVFNIEVETEHVYFVGGQSVLCHNVCPTTTTGNTGAGQAPINFAPVPQVVQNQRQGALGEAAVRARLLNSNRLDLVGEQIRIATPGVGSYRVTDFLVRSRQSGRLAIIEVKTGGATRNANQLAKDVEIGNPLAPTTFTGSRAAARGFPRGTPTGPIRTFEINASNLK